MPDPSRPDDPKTTGDAEALFDTDELRPIKVPPASTPSSPSASEGYELEGVSYTEVDETLRPVPIPVPSERPKTRSRPKPKDVALGPEDSGSTEFVTEVSDVDPVWTRAAEWGPDLVRVAGAGLGTLFLTWLFWNYSISWFVLLLGGAATVLLSYPMLITLERPVRITPEQAVTDFYAAASHHFPNYRRMWLLLSTLGRESGRFHGFEGFRDHWKARIDRWREAKRAGKYAPLKFEVDAFRADKSTGKETSRADYTVNVYLRDREGEGPIESIRMVHGLVKGPDRMWYLNRGTLDPSSK
jgi:hypothetical protein